VRVALKLHAIQVRYFIFMSIERNPFSAKNQTLRSYRTYICAYYVGMISSYSNRIFFIFYVFFFHNLKANPWK